MSINHWFSTTCIGLACALLPAISMAATCPTHFKQDTKGFWTSTDAPGWKSHRSTAKELTINTKAFGGAVFSPDKKRVACVYKTSDNKWIAFLSNTAHPFTKQNFAENKAWKFSKQHKDYMCGMPEHKLADCSFTITSEKK